MKSHHCLTKGIVTAGVICMLRLKDLKEVVLEQTVCVFCKVNEQVESCEDSPNSLWGEITKQTDKF